MRLQARDAAQVPAGGKVGAHRLYQGLRTALQCRMSVRVIRFLIRPKVNRKPRCPSSITMVRVEDKAVSMGVAAATSGSVPAPGA